LYQLNHRFIDAYDFYLRVDRRMTANTVLNHIIPLRKIIRRAISQDTLKRDPFASYVPEKPLKQRRHLTMEEFQKLLNTPVAEKYLEYERDMFVFACFTGMSATSIMPGNALFVPRIDEGVHIENIFDEGRFVVSDDDGIKSKVNDVENYVTGFLWEVTGITWCKKEEFFMHVSLFGE
jgi:hypothetical protein